MKDIGVARSKPKRKRYVSVTWELPANQAYTKPICAGPDPKQDVEDVENILRDPIPALGGGGPHTFFPLPVDNLDDTGKALLANIFSGDDIRSGQKAHRNDWFTTALADAPTFYQTLANSELHLEFLRNSGKDLRKTAVSIQFHQRAISALRKQLEEARLGKDAITDGMIGTVPGLIVYADIPGITEWWEPQRKGMLDLIRARPGGLSSLENNLNSTLRATVSWVELRGAYMQDLVPLVPLPMAWVARYGHEFADGHNNAMFGSKIPGLRNAMRKHFPDNALEVFDSIAKLADKVSSLLKSGNRQETDVLVWTNVVAHGLLCLRPFEDLRINSKYQLILEACRLGLLILIAAIYSNYGAHPHPSKVHIEKLNHMLGLEMQWGSIGTLQKWATVLLNWGLEARVHAGYYTVNDLAEVKSVLWLPELLDAA